jgi:hypothetical protein
LKGVQHLPTIEQYDHLECIEAWHHDHDWCHRHGQRQHVKPLIHHQSDEPNQQGRKKAAGASIMPISVRIKRRSFAPSAKRPAASAVRGELLNSIAKAQPDTKLATARKNSFSV